MNARACVCVCLGCSVLCGFTLPLSPHTRTRTRTAAQRYARAGAGRTLALSVLLEHTHTRSGPRCPLIHSFFLCVSLDSFIHSASTRAHTRACKHQARDRDVLLLAGEMRAGRVLFLPRSGDKTTYRDISTHIYAHVHTFPVSFSCPPSAHSHLHSLSHFSSLSCFRYGIGMIYYRQEKYELAEYYFSRALEINPSSAVLRCYLAMVCGWVWVRVCLFVCLLSM